MGVLRDIARFVWRSFLRSRTFFLFFCSRCDRARLGRPLWPFGASPVSTDVTGSGVARSRAFARPRTGSSSGMSWCGLVLALFFYLFSPLSLSPPSLSNAITSICQLLGERLRGGEWTNNVERAACMFTQENKSLKRGTIK